jgi:hypothetical protein
LVAISRDDRLERQAIAVVVAVDVAEKAAAKRVTSG